MILLKYIVQEINWDMTAETFEQYNLTIFTVFQLKKKRISKKTNPLIFLYNTFQETKNGYILASFLNNIYLNVMLFLNIRSL